MTELVELYRKHRPTSLKRLKGQDEAVAILRAKVKAKQIPHAILLVGPSGCGKTTVGRILGNHLDCVDNDFQEINCAGNGIDSIRDIGNRINLKGLRGGARIWFLDEIQKLSVDGQNRLLKMLEDPPDHVYFILATTDPHKVIKTIHTRCMKLKLNLLTAKALQEVLADVIELEGLQIDSELIDAIVDVSEGSARQALVTLDAIRSIQGKEGQLAAIASPDSQTVAFDIVKALLYEKPSWVKVSKILTGLQNEDAEGLRYLILTCATKQLLKGGKPGNRAYMIVTAFRDNFYDSKYAGLVAACWEVVNPI